MTTVHYRPRSKAGDPKTVATVYCCGKEGGISPRGKMPPDACLTTDVERVTCVVCMGEIERVVAAKREWLAHACSAASTVAFNTWTNQAKGGVS